MSDCLFALKLARRETMRKMRLRFRSMTVTARGRSEEEVGYLAVDKIGDSLKYDELSADS